MGSCEMHASEPGMRQAAALILHWERGDIEAVVLLIGDIPDQAQAEDIITAMLILRERELRDLERMLVT